MKNGYTMLVAMLFSISASKNPGPEALPPAASPEPSGANKGNASSFIRLLTSLQ